MATKSKGSKRAAKAKARPAAKPAMAARPAGAGKLREVIGELIDAHNRGDQQQRETAVRALEKLGSSGAPEVRQRAVEARAAAGHPVPVDSVRLLGEIAARLDSR